MIDDDTRARFEAWYAETMTDSRAMMYNNPLKLPVDGDTKGCMLFGWQAATARAIPEGLQSAVREAAEIMQAVADSGVQLPPNWRWPLADELSGFAYLLMDRTVSAEGNA